MKMTKQKNFVWDIVTKIQNHHHHHRQQQDHIVLAEEFVHQGIDPKNHDNTDDNNHNNNDVILVQHVGTRSCEQEESLQRQIRWRRPELLEFTEKNLASASNNNKNSNNNNITSPFSSFAYKNYNNNNNHGRGDNDSSHGGLFNSFPGIRIPRDSIAGTCTLTYFKYCKKPYIFSTPKTLPRSIGSVGSTS